MSDNDESLKTDDIYARFEALSQKDKLWPAVIAARASLRVFPLLGSKGNFNFWLSQKGKLNTGGEDEGEFAEAQENFEESKARLEDRRVEHLLAIFVASHCVLEQARLLKTDRQEAKFGAAVSAAADAYESTNSANSAAKAAAAAAASAVTAADSAAVAEVAAKKATAAAEAATRARAYFPTASANIEFEVRDAARAASTSRAAVADFAARDSARAAADNAAKAIADTTVIDLADAASEVLADFAARNSDRTAAAAALKNDLENVEESSEITAVIDKALWPEKPPENVEFIRHELFTPAVLELAEESVSVSPDGAKALKVMLLKYDEYLTGKQTASSTEVPMVDYRPPTTQIPEEATGELDSLNREALVNGLSCILCDDAHTSPLTIGLMGHWGSGKTTVLELLKKKLLGNGCAQPFLFGEFNAWAYEHAKNSQAAMAHEVISALSACDTLQVVSTNASSWEKFKGSFSNLIRKIRWQLGGRLRLVFGFAVQRHTEKLLGMMFWLLLFTVAFIIFLGQGKGLTPTADITKPVTFLSLFVTLGSFWKFTKGLRDVISQPLTNKLLTYIKLPDYAAHIGEISQMQQDIRVMARLRLGFTEKECYDYLGKKTPQRRLLFVVDDLDRCSPQGIVKTFEAIRLVLNIPHVTVIVAVDQRIALAALALHYKEIEPYHTLQDAKAIARDYLAKMIQLPVVLGNGDDESIKTYLGEIWPKDKESEWLRHFAETTKPKQSEAGKPDIDEPKEDLEKQATPHPEDIREEETEAEALTKEQLIEMVLTEPTKPTPPPPEIKVGLSDLQKAALYFWATQFGLTNARQLKRLDNSYNLFRLVSETEDEVCVQGKTRGLSEKAVTFSFGFLVTLMALEFINSIEVNILRTNASRYLRAGGEEKLALMANKQHVSALKHARIIIKHASTAMWQDIPKPEAFERLLAYIENFVLPAIEGFEIDTETNSGPTEHRDKVAELD